MMRNSLTTSTTTATLNTFLLIITVAVTTLSVQSTFVPNHRLPHITTSSFHRPTCRRTVSSLDLSSSSSSPTQTTLFLESISQKLNEALEECRSEVFKTVKVKAAPSPTTGRLGLVATANLPAGQVALAMPYDDRWTLSPTLVKDTIYQFSEKQGSDSLWTGQLGLLALGILNEVALASSGGTLGRAVPERSESLQAFWSAWVEALPSPAELRQLHPLGWSESDQEILQGSSTRKIYQTLDDLEEDAAWLLQNIWSRDRTVFPEQVVWNGQSLHCCTTKGFQWAMAAAMSRTFQLDGDSDDGQYRIFPLLDLCNHQDDATEISATRLGGMPWNPLTGAQLVVARDVRVGEEVFCSYGTNTKTAAQFLLQYGFCPPACWKNNVAEIILDIDPDDRFRDDKIDILEFETYDEAPMDPTQTYLVGGGMVDGEPDSAMMQFARLCKLGGTDAFLLESIFRKEVWNFMALPVSETNECQAIEMIRETCQKALDGLSATGGPDVCATLRESESKALRRTIEFLQREKEALDLKVYYQERRLRDLGLDSEWTPEDDMMDDSDLGLGPTSRVPGGADYDW